MSTPFARWAIAGVLATLTMDLGATLARASGLTAGVPPRWMGRWFAGLARGHLAHATIAQAPPVRGELPLALVCHYLIGITLALAFAAMVAKLRLPPGQVFAWALIFGVASNFLPWLVMFPSMGFGAFGARGPAELALLRTSFVNHLFFATGLAVFGPWLAGAAGG